MNLHRGNPSSPSCPSLFFPALFILLSPLPFSPTLVHLINLLSGYSWPLCSFPDVYLLDGGYRKFFDHHKVHFSLYFIFYILYFIFYILYFIFYILYFIFYILYFIFYILYFIFYILYFIFYILYFIFYILYFIFYILYFIFYILYFIFYILYFKQFANFLHLFSIFRPLAIHKTMFPRTPNNINNSVSSTNEAERSSSEDPKAFLPKTPLSSPPLPPSSYPLLVILFSLDR